MEEQMELYEVFGFLLSEDQVRACTLAINEFEGMWTEVYLIIDEYWVEEIAAPLNRDDLKKIRWELVTIKGRIWNKENA